jgi:hypothetical protein
MLMLQSMCARGEHPLNDGPRRGCGGADHHLCHDVLGERQQEVRQHLLISGVPFFIGRIRDHCLFILDLLRRRADGVDQISFKASSSLDRQDLRLPYGMIWLG